MIYSLVILSLQHQHFSNSYPTEIFSSDRALLILKIHTVLLEKNKKGNIDPQIEFRFTKGVFKCCKI